MGCDIHYAIERRGPDGWHCVMTKTRFFDLFETASHYFKLWSPESWDMDHPDLPAGLTREGLRSAYGLGNRNYERFSTLSDVRSAPERLTPPLAISGLPEDPTDLVAWYLDIEDHDLHSHGWLTLGDLRAVARADPAARTTELGFRAETDPVLFETAHDEIRRDIHEAASFQRSLLGCLDDPVLGGTIMLHEPSAHERLAAQNCARRLLPVGDETVRVVIAYDN